MLPTAKTAGLCFTAIIKFGLEQAGVQQEHCSMYRPNNVSSLCVWAVFKGGG